MINTRGVIFVILLNFVAFAILWSKCVVIGLMIRRKRDYACQLLCVEFRPSKTPSANNFRRVHFYICLRLYFV